MCLRRTSFRETTYPIPNAKEIRNKTALGDIQLTIRKLLTLSLELFQSQKQYNIDMNLKRNPIVLEVEG